MHKEIQLITQIEKYDILYNFNIPSYNRKDLVEDAWHNISESCDLTISDCKEKWRNIRSSFLRSMKPNGSRTKKPYYLAEYLHFIMPFMKPLNISENIEVSQPETPQTIDGEIMIDIAKIEPEDVESDKNESDPISDGESEILSTTKMNVRKRKIPLKTKNNVSERKRFKEQTILHNIEVKDRNDCTSTGNLNSSSNALQMFFMSLLPEFETMSEEQIRTFKIKTMTLIDEIKSNYSEVKRSDTSLSNERLQKRLIHLLLKNLRYLPNC